MTSRLLILTVLVSALGTGLAGCSGESGPIGPQPQPERQFYGSWRITVPADFDVTISYSRPYGGRNFSAAREEGNIGIWTYHSDLVLPDFDALDDPVVLAPGVSYDRIAIVETDFGTVNALYRISRSPGPPIRTAALVVGEETTHLGGGRFQTVGLAGYDEGYLDDVLDVVRTIRQVSGE